MRIGELAHRTGTSVRSLRYYEQQELIVSERTSGGQRQFHEDTVERVHAIRCLLAGGVPTRHIVDMLACVHSGTTTAANVELLRAERVRLNARIDDLVRTRDRLDDILAQSIARVAV